MAGEAVRDAPEFEILALKLLSGAPEQLIRPEIR